MFPIRFWLLSYQIGKAEYKSKNLYRCEIFHDRIEIYDGEQEVLRLLIGEIRSAKDNLFAPNDGRWFVTINSMERVLPFKFEPANPLSPKNKVYGTAKPEAVRMKLVINELMKNQQTSIEANPYLRNLEGLGPRLLIDTDEIDLTLDPETLYENYFKKKWRIFYFIVLPVIWASVMLLLWIILQVFFIFQ